MDDKIKILLDKINIDENSYQYFSDAKIVKIKINQKKDRKVQEKILLHYQDQCLC